MTKRFFKDGPKTDVYETITNKIIEAIERGAETYEMPWNRKSGSGFLPINASNGKPYRGVNVIALWAAQQSMGYQSNEWATFKQWKEKGAAVRKGEKSTTIVFWKFLDPDGPDERPDGEIRADGEGRVMMARAYPVFCADQVEGYTPKAAPPAVENTAERVDHAEQFFKRLGADLRHGGNAAYYSPINDHIQMPPFEEFKTVDGYYSVLAHEHTHWTGHASRVGRDLKGRFGDGSYAMEELIAELGAAFTMGVLGLSNEPRDDHAAYINSWLQVLKGDKRAIFSASSKAQEAMDFFLKANPDYAFTVADELEDATAPPVPPPDLIKAQHTAKGPKVGL